MSFEVGRTYSGHQFLGLVKETATTVVYRVRRAPAGASEFLYVVKQEAHDAEQQRERLMREMRLRVRLSHPNIPAFLDAFELEGRLVMTTESVDGRTLAEVLQRGPLPSRDAIAWTRQILSALACAHEFHIVHRDISPENIVITDEGVLKLTNFGLAKGASSPQLTQTGTILGNCKYMSPEQARGIGELDGRSDIYSVGALLFHMLCGRPPFLAASEFEVMLAQVKETPKPPSSFQPAVPANLDAAVMKALAKDPAQRYAGCEEFSEALETLTAAREEPPAPTAPRRNFKPWTMLGGTAAGIGILLLAIWFMVRA